MVKQRAFLAAGVLISSVLVGCTSDDDPPTDDRADEQVDADGEATDADHQDDTGGGADGDTDAGDGDDDAADGGDEASPQGEVAIGQTQTHGGGVELTVRSIRVEADGIFVDVEAFNGASADVFLAIFQEVDLVDDTGRTYNFRPPEDNPGLEIETGGTLEGSLAFLGRLPTEAASLTLRFNYDGDEELEPSDGDHADLADAPSFEFTDLPLPGDDA